MKQTKPYGRAHLTSAEREFLARQETKPTELQSTRPPLDGGGNQDIFNLTGDSLSPGSADSADKRPTLLRQVMTYVLVVMAALTVFVLVRDSLLMAQLLEQVSSREAVMVCKEGTMHYSGYNPLDRLLGKGHFVCTEWSIQRGMLSIPRPYY